MDGLGDHHVQKYVIPIKKVLDIFFYLSNLQSERKTTRKIEGEG
jgi:hypothetical protein